jgi:hypothetical protein
VASGAPELARAALRAARRFPALLEAASLRRAFLSEDEPTRNTAMETGLVLGLPEAWRACEHAITSSSDGWGSVAQVWALGASGLDLGPLLHALENPTSQRAALWALGFSGRLAAADALLAPMRDARLAPLAAEAFSAITGLPLGPGFIKPPEDRDEDSAGPDADLPQPDAERIEQWWTEARPRFKASERYLAGSPWSPERLLQALEHGPMRRRPLLALELAIRTGGRSQLGTALLTTRQRQDLARLRSTLGRVPSSPFRELMHGWAPPPPSPRPGPVARVTAPTRTPGALAITGMGMVTAIGHGAVETCASLRARIVRPRPLPLQVISSDEPGAVAATGHPIRGLVDGFTGLARLIKSGALALEDLLRSAEFPMNDARFLQRTALLICLSPTRRDEWEFYDELLAEQLPARILRHTSLAIPTRNVSVLQNGHASGLLALQKGAGLLQEGQFQRALVLGVDSLVEEDALQWLASRRRLKTPESPMGLMPGEAGAAVLLEIGAEAKRRAVPALGTLDAIGVGRAENETRKGTESGRALAHAIRQAWPAGDPPVGDIYGDLNGEHDRAMEWGCAQALLRATHPLDTAHLHVPAECLGDTGAASGLISLCAALRAFAREYAYGDHALIWSSSDSGEFAAARLSRP